MSDSSEEPNVVEEHREESSTARTAKSNRTTRTRIRPRQWIKLVTTTKSIL